MESIGSNSPPSDRHRRSTIPFNPTQSIADRISRALRHSLSLLHRSGHYFYVLGATHNVYTVTLTPSPTCTCPDPTVPCKHILFVFLRVLRLPLDDTCLRRRTLRPCQLTRLLGTPTSPESLSGVRARERFYQILTGTVHSHSRRTDGWDGATCPICLEVMVIGDKVSTCGTCENSLHEECFLRWKRIRGRRVASCVMCRARWREKKEAERYVNLAAYVSDEGGVGSCGG